MTRAKGRCLTEPPRCPQNLIFFGDRERGRGGSCPII